MEQARGDIGRTQGQELLSAVDHLVPFGRERSRREHIVGVADDGDAESGGHECGQLDPAEARQCRGRQPARDLADHGDAGPVKAEQDHDPGGQQHRDQGPRKAREPAVNGKQEQQHADRERQRRQVGLVELRGERTQLRRRSSRPPRRSR